MSSLRARPLTTSRCRHCGQRLIALLFDASGRVWIPQPGRRSRRRNVPLFPSYSLFEADFGLPAPPAIVCDHCDTGDPELTPERVAYLLDWLWRIEA